MRRVTKSTQTKAHAGGSPSSASDRLESNPAPPESVCFNRPWALAQREVFSYQRTEAKPSDLVTICVTNYHYGHHIEECLDSLRLQEHKALDLVVVDDCSHNDDSIDVASTWLKKWASRFFRATLVQHTRNQGVSEARNTAFRLALSEYVFVIDADNEAYPRAVSRLFQVMRDNDQLSNDGFAAVYPQLEEFGDRVGIGHADIWDPRELRHHNYVDVTAIVRKSAWEKVLGYSHIDEGWEDYDFWLKFVDAGMSCGYVPEILCRYRVHAKSRTATEALVAHDRLKLIMALRHPFIFGGEVSPP